MLLLTFGAGCEGDYAYYAVTPCPTPAFSLYGTAAMANIQANHAQETAAAMQMTAEAINAVITQEAQQTVAAREQWLFEQTQIAVAATSTAAALQATRTAEANATGTAIAYAQATETAQAHRTATAIAYTQATATAQAAQTATAVYYAEQTAVAAPTATLTAANLATELTQRRWEQATTPIVHVLRLVLWVALALVGVAALVWLIPRAWHALMLRFLAFRTGSPDMPLILAVVNRGLFKAWVQAPQLTTYNADRDGGPGQAIDLNTGDAKALPGGSPEVVRSDQIVDTVTRPVAAAAQNGRRLHPGAAVQAAGRLHRQSRLPYVMLPATDTPPPQIAGQVEILDAQWEEIPDEQ